MWTVVVRDPKGIELYRLPLNGKLVIGRTHDCQIVLKSNAVSRQHARMELFDNKPVFVDLGSSNGSLLNGKPLTKPAILDAKSRIEVGDFQISLEPAMYEGDKTGITRSGFRPPAPSAPAPVMPAAQSPGIPKPEKDVMTMAPPAQSKEEAAPKPAGAVAEDDMDLVPLKPMAAAPAPKPAAAAPGDMHFLDLPSAPSPTESAPKPRAATDSAVDLLDQQLAGIRTYRDETVLSEKARAAQVDAEWIRVLVSIRQLKAKIEKHPKVQHFTISRDEQEVSIKVEDSSKRGYSYYVLGRRHPTGKYDDPGVVWMCELGGEELSYKQAKEAMADLVRRIAPRLA